ncbi:MAG TPA: hypothetical protein VGI73_01410 [Solirubrobacterales bacterium]|jgi:hypothetical protein
MTAEHSPWRPPSLHHREKLDHLAYVVVEEEIDGTMGLVVAHWPSGGRGAPRFRDDGEFEVAVDREELQRRLAERRVPEAADLPDAVAAELRSRRVEVGDVFAIEVLGELSPDDDWRNCEWVGETIDLTAEAREAAKAKMYEALTPELDKRMAKRLIADAKEPREPAA